jgi:hypothetical protein
MFETMAWLRPERHRPQIAFPLQTDDHRVRLARHNLLQESLFAVRHHQRRFPLLKGVRPWRNIQAGHSSQVRFRICEAEDPLAQWLTGSFRRTQLR